jgi:hypothetical protein
MEAYLNILKLFDMTSVRHVRYRRDACDHPSDASRRVFRENRHSSFLLSPDPDLTNPHFRYQHTEIRARAWLDTAGAMGPRGQARVKSPAGRLENPHGGERRRRGDTGVRVGANCIKKIFSSSSAKRESNRERQKSRRRARVTEKTRGSVVRRIKIDFAGCNRDASSKESLETDTPRAKRKLRMRATSSGWNWLY